MRRTAEAPKRRRSVLRSAAGALVGHPTATGGGLVVSVMAAAILTNALTLQPGLHPAPLFQGTRPVPAEDLLPPGDARTAAPDPADALDALVARETGIPAVDHGLVADVQKHLKARGYYAGNVDGLTGPMTSAAVAAFEKAAGLSVTGEPSGDVLAALKRRRTPAADQNSSLEPLADQPSALAVVPLPTRAPKRPPPEDTAPVTPARLSPAEVPQAAPAIARDIAPAEAQNGAGAPADVAVVPVAESDPRLAKVQEALDLLGFGPIRADGFMTPATRDAIRRFEENRGLPVTGEINQRFLSELVKIGGLSR